MTAGRMLEHTRLPLTKRFLAIDRVSQAGTGPRTGRSSLAACCRALKRGRHAGCHLAALARRPDRPDRRFALHDLVARPIVGVARARPDKEVRIGRHAEAGF